MSYNFWSVPDHPFTSIPTELALQIYRITDDLSFPPSNPSFMNVQGEPAFNDGPDGTVNIAKQLAGHFAQSWCLEKRESFVINGLRTART